MGKERVRGREGRGEEKEGRGRHGFWGWIPLGRERGKGRGRRKGEDPQCPKCVDASVNVHNYNVGYVFFFPLYFVNINIILFSLFQVIVKDVR